ncbi:cellulose binding domain-containing protein [Streptomyces sp. NPDC055078]
MVSSAQRRRKGRRITAVAAAVAVLATGGALVAVTGTAQAAAVGAAYTRTSAWAGGYTGQYVITNDTGRTKSDWTLEFELPAGTTIGSLWNGEHTTRGQRVTVKPPSWKKRLGPGASVTVGFVTRADGTGTGHDPVSCLIGKTKCSAQPGSGTRPTVHPTGRPTPTPSVSVPAPTGTPPTRQPTAPSPSGAVGFSPYVDASLHPAYDLLGAAAKTGIKHFNLAFVRAGRSCNPRWGGVTGLGRNKVARQIGSLRARGGDVRVSFGGGDGSELAQVCSSPAKLATAYAEVVDTYRLTEIDFDIEGKALPDAAANTRRAKAIARLQESRPGLKVTYTLPVRPHGLTQPGVDLLTDARRHGVRISTVNVMAMDFGTAYSGDMSGYAIRAATATHTQLKGILGLSDTAAWKSLAITPMIGLNDIESETFTVRDAGELAAFARSKNIGWLSMWSLARDKRCHGNESAAPAATCSSIRQQPLAFAKALAGSP